VAELLRANEVDRRRRGEDRRAREESRELRSPRHFIQTDDARGLYETLKARGVTDFTQEPTDHFYDTDMGVRGHFGNAIRILQPAKLA
jgi:hypothetical protein